MKELQRKQRMKRILYSVPSLFIFMIITFVLVRGAARMMAKKNESNDLVTDAEKKYAALLIKNEELTGSVEKLKTEEGIESEIKKRFNVVKEGEHIAVIVDARAASSSDKDIHLPWYKKIWNAIISPL